MYLKDEFDYNHDGELDDWEKADRDQVLYELQLPREKRSSEISRMIDDRGLDTRNDKNDSNPGSSIGNYYKKTSSKSSNSDFNFGLGVFIGIAIAIISLFIYIATMK